MTQQPLIGLFSASWLPFERMVPLRLRAVAAEAALQGAGFVIVPTDGVDLPAGRVSGWVLEPDGWCRRDRPLPDVIMNPLPPADNIDLRVYQELYQRIPFTTTHLPDKVGVAELLRGTPLDEHVIPYRPLDRERLTECLGGFLAEHGRVVLKPAHGRRGSGILFLARVEGGILVREQAGERTVSLDDLVRMVEPRTADQTWVLQRFVVSRARDGRSFDIRVHVHKDGAGAWDVVRAYVRLGEAGLLVANTSRGGYQGDVEHFFAGLKEEGAALVRRLHAVALSAAATLDRRHQGALDELGVDLLVDGAKGIWIVEVNTHPQSRYHEFERARFAVAYALHRARTRFLPDWRDLPAG
ncbi:MAG TPA: YheC/YheD family protein [Azospirillum sp.]|nr:YheC/YheD family protein [Azospirillum sp.]